MDYSKLLLHPARLRILQYATLRGQVTAGELVEALGDIPRATVYHHVKLLEEHGALVTVAENKVRGTTEKVLSPTGHSAPAENRNPMVLAAALSADLLGELNVYFAQSDADMERDRVFFQKGVFALTNEEYDDLLREITVALRKAAALHKTPERRFRTLALVSTLPTEKDGEQA